MKLKNLLVFASAAAMPFATALAQNNSTPSGPQGTGWYANSAPYGHSMPSFEALDRNGDGVISADEFAAADVPAAPAYGSPSAGATLPPSFAQYDRNGDGVITRDEYPRQQRSGRDERMPYSGFSADTNPPVPPQ